jgi:hypothetical protein
MKKDEETIEQKLQNSVNTLAIQHSEDKKDNINDNIIKNSNSESTIINNEIKNVVSFTQSQPVQIDSKSSLSTSPQIQSTVFCPENNTSSSLNNSKIDLNHSANFAHSSGSDTPNCNSAPNSTSNSYSSQQPSIENLISLDSSVNHSTFLGEGGDFNKQTNSQTTQEPIVSMGIFLSFLSTYFHFKIFYFL